MRSTSLYAIAGLLVAALLVGCTPGDHPRDRGPVAKSTETEGPATDRAGPTVVFLGTSLTAGYGLERDQAFPRLVQSKIDSAGLDYRVVNAGVSGETSAGALRRVDWLLRQPIDVLVIETGANDGLRGQNPAHLEANVQAIIDRALTQEPPPRLVLLGMAAPPNLGRAYTRRFGAVFRDVADRNGILLVPFLLEGVAGIDSLNQPDGIHPTARGQEIMAQTVWRFLEPMLDGESGVGSRE